MTRPRKFDYTECRRRFKNGETKTELARAFGVSFAAVDRVVNPHRRAQMDVSSAMQFRARCIDCGGPCVFNPWMPQAKGRCRACNAIYRTTTVRDDGLKCLTCQEWKWDTEFPHHRGQQHRRGRHTSCRACLTLLRQEYRERHKVPCSHCGAPCLPASEKGARGKDTRLCLSCYRNRKSLRAVASA